MSPLTPTSSSRARRRKTPPRPIQLVAAVVGVVFLLVGALGFVPGITANFVQLSFAGHHEGALLLGVFAVTVLHNLVHIAFGIAGLLMASTARRAAVYLTGGAIYLLLCSTGSRSTPTARRTSSRSTPPTTRCTSASASAWSPLLRRRRGRRQPRRPDEAARRVGARRRGHGRRRAVRRGRLRPQRPHRRVRQDR